MRAPSNRIQGGVLAEGFSQTAVVFRPIRPSGPRFCETNPFLDTPSLNALPGDPGDVHIHGHGGRGAAPGAAGGLEALELV